MKRSIAALQSADSRANTQFQRDTNVRLGQLSAVQGDIGKIKSFNEDTSSRISAIENALNGLSAVPAKVKVLESNYETLSKWRMDDVKPTLQLVGKLDTRLKERMKQIDGMANDISDLQSSQEKDTTELERVQKELAGKQDDVKKEVDRLRRLADTFASSKDHNALRETVATLDDSVGGLKMGYNEMSTLKAAEQTAGKSQAGTGIAIDEDSFEMVKMLGVEEPKLINTVESLDAKLDMVSRDIDAMKDHIYDDRNGKLVGRVAKIEDRLKNEMPRDGNSSSAQRLSEVERAVKSMKLELSGSKRTATPNAGSPSISDLAAMGERVGRLEKQVVDLQESREELQEVVSTYTDEEIQKVASGMTELRSRREEDLQKYEAMKTSLSSVKTSLTELQHELSTKASSQDIKKELVRVSNNLSSLQTDVEQMKKQQREQQQLEDQARDMPRNSTATSAQQQQQYPRQPPHLQNSRNLSLVNGTPPLHSPGQTTFAQRLQLNPSAQPQQQLQILYDEVNRLTLVTQHLTTRFDNLTTDDLVKQMIDQLAIMYPPAKDWATSIKTLRNGCSDMEQRVNAMKQEQITNVEKLNSNVEGLRSTLENMQKEIEIVRNGATNRPNGVPSQGSPSLGNGGIQINDLRKRLDAVTTVAVEAGKRAESTEKLCLKLEGRLGEVDVKKMEPRLQKKIGDFEKTIDEMKKEVDELSAGFDVVKERAVTMTLEFQKMQEDQSE
jgi:hypothetical protein